ncbi:porin family protein [Pedobacter frigoris]|uniref:Porin family protein n=2 Tax=Pedobacter frigoris TaxID=2571272 RepID=A0A4U1CK22_9SPHI|nr:porin family protein [Pedobacter frigoris]
MTMKNKLILSTALLAAASLTTLAQEKGFYIKPTGSYFMKVTPVEFPAINGQLARDKTTTITGTGASATTSTSETALTGSFGQGFRAGLVGGYQFNNVIGLEVGLNYFSSEKQDMLKQTVINNGTTALSLHAVGQVKAFDVAPALVFRLPGSGKFQPYSKIGVIVPVGGYLEINTAINDQTGQISASQGTVSPPGTRTTLVLSREERINPKATVGFQSALGFDYKIGNVVSLFSELEYRNISVGGKDKELRKYDGTATVVVNATNTPAGSKTLTLADQPTGDKEVNYHKTITSSMNVKGQANYDASKPSDDLRSYINIGGLGLNVGIKIGI